MSLGFSWKVTMLLMTVTLLTPYFIIEQSLLGGTSVRIVAPIWSFVSHSGAAFFFEFPFGLTIDYLPFWGIGLIITGMTYFSISREDLTKLGYAIVMIILLLMQLGYFLVISYITSNGPSISITPIPIVALLALLMTPIIIRAPSSSWESGSSS
jgi:hypothetical protein